MEWLEQVNHHTAANHHDEGGGDRINIHLSVFLRYGSTTTGKNTQICEGPEEEGPAKQIYI